ncbi:sulfotransferase [Lewinella sp. JB7]|uniref:sulfotransferase n=1 Tax=Lewinella sp. JB7 TaxID=2962887 RepID=UPI0020C9F948|nr:sulfotransferase [Lewinella sp. JB7]MCP9236559.1 sulfotransferase [Lewinella sp. JB7]
MHSITRQRINLWSSPRNISTALLYAFAQRSDTRVVDEPLYAHYLCRQPTEADHPGRQAVLDSQEHDGQKVVDRMLHHDYGAPVVVFKQMTHHLVDLDRSFLTRMTNVLLIRDPREILASFSRVVDRVTDEDIGLPQQGRLFTELHGTRAPAAVLDSRRLLEDPPGVLMRLCDHLDLPYEPAMLSWPAGPKPYDGSWAEYWYAGVHESTGFHPYRPKSAELPPALNDIAERCRPIYEKLLTHAL